MNTKKVFDLKRRAEQFAEKGELQDAAELYGEAAQLAPDDVSLEVNAGSLFKKAGKTSESVKSFAAAAQRYARQGDFLRSLSLCAKALALDSENKEVIALLNGPFLAAHERGELLGEAKNRFIGIATEVAKSGSHSTQKDRDDVWEKAIVEVLCDVPIFSFLDPSEIVPLASTVEIKEVAAGEAIVEEGDSDKDFFVIVGGSCDVSVTTRDRSKRVIRKLESGSFFGELAYFLNVKRTATVTARTPTELLVFKGEVLRRLTSNNPEIAKTLDRFFLERLVTSVFETSEIFGALSAPDCRTLIERFQPVNVKKGEIIIVQGKESAGLYIIGAGEVLAASRFSAGKTITYPLMNACDMFGEISFMTNKPPTATCTAVTDCKLFLLPKNELGGVMRRFPGMHAAMKKSSKERMMRSQVLANRLKR